MFLPSFSSVVWSAFRAGGCSLVVWRSSARSASGLVAAAFFGSAGVAAAFARRWAARVGVAVAVRRVRGGFAVSVPVARWAGYGHGAVVCAGRGGGVRGVAGGLRRALVVQGVGYC